MKIRKWLALVPMLAVPLLFTTPAQAEGAVQIQLTDINNTGATGTASLTPTGDGGLQVSIQASGMTPNSPHAQHIHGATDGTDFHCPDMSADADGDGFINTEEGLPDYGDIFISLTTTGDTTKASGLALDRFPVADAAGNLTYDRTLTPAELPVGTLEHLADLHVVQHGIDVNGNGTYDLEGLGESSFAQSLGVAGVPEEGTNPATCGMAAGAAAGSTPAGGVDTGTGPASDTEHTLLLVGGAVLLTAGAGVGVVATRRRHTHEQ